MPIPESLQSLLEKIVARAQDDASTDLARALRRIAEEHAVRGLRGGAVNAAQTAAIIGSAQDESARILAEVLAAVRATYGGSVPDEIAMPVRDYLVGHAERIERRLHAQVLLKASDLTIAEDLAQRVAKGIALALVRNVEIEFGPALVRQQLRALPSTLEAASKGTSRAFDVFVSHASEDKASFVDALVSELKARGRAVWYDKAVLTVGDNLAVKISDGLQQSRFGVVVLSPAFFAKGWTAFELGALAAAQATENRKIILPVWHNVSRDDVSRHSRLLAALLGTPSSKGPSLVAEELVHAMNSES